MSDRIWTVIKSILWIIVELALFVILFVPLAALFTWLAIISFSGEESYNIGENPILTLVLDYLPLFLASIISLYVTHVLIFKRSWISTGFTKKWYSMDTAVAGFLAFAFLALSFIVLYMLGFMQIDEVNFDPALFFGFMLLFLVQSSFEEIVSRGPPSHFMLHGTSFKVHFSDLRSADLMCIAIWIPLRLVQIYIREVPSDWRVL